MRQTIEKFLKKNKEIRYVSMQQVNAMKMLEKTGFRVFTAKELKKLLTDRQEKK